MVLLWDLEHLLLRLFDMSLYTTVFCILYYYNKILYVD